MIEELNSIKQKATVAEGQKKKGKKGGKKATKKWATSNLLSWRLVKRWSKKSSPAICSHLLVSGAEWRDWLCGELQLSQLL